MAEQEPNVPRDSTQRLGESAFFFEAVEILRSGEYLLTAKPEDLLSRI